MSARAGGYLAKDQEDQGEPLLDFYNLKFYASFKLVFSKRNPVRYLSGPLWSPIHSTTVLLKIL